MVGPRVQKIASVRDRFRGFAWGTLEREGEGGPTSTHSHERDGASGGFLKESRSAQLRRRLAPAGGAAASRFLPRRGTAGSAASRPSSPEGVGTLGGGRARVRPLGKDPEPFWIEKQPPQGASCVEPSVFRPREEVQADALPCPHRLPASLHLRSPTPTVLPRPFVLQVGSGWVGSPGRRCPRCTWRGRGLSPGFRPAVLALRVPLAPPPLDLGSSVWAFPPLFPRRRLPGLQEKEG